MQFIEQMHTYRLLRKGPACSTKLLKLSPHKKVFLRVVPELGRGLNVNNRVADKAE